MIEIKGIDPKMIANNTTAFEPTHPGELLKGEIEYRGITQTQLAKQMGMSHKILNDILNQHRPLTTTTAMLFEAALGVNAGFLMRMQLQYNIQMAYRDKDFTERLLKIRKIAAIL